MGNEEIEARKRRKENRRKNKGSGRAPRRMEREKMVLATES